MKPVYLSLAQWETVRRCIQQASESLLVQSYEAGDNKEAREALFNLSERRKRLAANILDQLTVEP